MRNGLLLVALLGLTACGPTPTVQDKDVLDYINSCSALGFDSTIEIMSADGGMNKRTYVTCSQVKSFKHPYR